MTKRKRKTMSKTAEVEKTGLAHQGTIDPKAMAAFSAGQGWLATSAEEPRSKAYALDEAIQAFERALLYQPDFLDAHLWIARLTPDRQARRDHLEFILKKHPKHAEARRLLDDLGSG